MWGIAISILPPLKRKYAKFDGFDPKMFVERRASRYKYIDSDGNPKYTLIPSPMRPFNKETEPPEF